VKPPKRGRPPRTRVLPHGPPRDTDATTFSPILTDLVARVPGAVGAVLIDTDGEAVDYTGRLHPFDLKLAGAHWQIVLREFRSLAATRPIGAPSSLLIRAARRSYIAHALPEDYALVLILRRRAGFTPATRAFAVCERALTAEAGWGARTRAPAWFAVDVAVTRAGRPTRVRAGSREHTIEVVGRIAGLAVREDGWRIRLEHGAELTLIREPGDHWYADESLDALAPPLAASPDGRRPDPQRE
jgi:hypothetical protein